MSSTTTPPPEEKEKSNPLDTVLVVLYLIWIIAGIVAFFMSLNCFRYQGSWVQKIGALLLAIFFGPFYFIYYKLSDRYCK